MLHLKMLGILRDASCLIVIFVALSLFLQSAPLRDTANFSLGAINPLVLHGFNRAETTDRGRGFRWTDGDATVELPSEGSGAHLLSLTIGLPALAPTASAATISVNDWSVPITLQSGTDQRYSIVVPAEHIRVDQNSVRIKSPSFRPQDDQRALGVALFEMSWQRIDPQPWLVPIQIGAIALATLLLWLLLIAAGIPFWPRLSTTILFLAITLAMRHSDQRFIYRVHAIVVTLGLGALFAIALALIRRNQPQNARLLPFGEWIAIHWPALAGYTIATIAMLWPLVAHLNDRILGVPGDSYEFLWKLQWFSDALVKQHTSPAFTPQLFYPEGFDLVGTDMSATQTLLGLPITLWFGPIISYNVAILASYVLSGVFTYLLVDRITGKRGAAWVAGLLFAFCVRRYYHALSGHLSLTGTQWFPLALYGWEGFIDRRRLWDGLLAGLGVGLSAWSSWYYGPTLAVLLALYLPLRIGARALPGLLESRSWRALLLAGVTALALIVPLAQPYVEAAQQGQRFKLDIMHLRANAALPTDFLLPNPWHPLYGLWGVWPHQLHREDGNEHHVALGYSLIALALAGIWRGRRNSSLVRGLVVIIIISMLLSLGPELVLPSGSRLPMPALFVYNYIPILNGIRVWNRMILYVVLCAAALAGVALASVRPRRSYLIWCGVTTIVVLFEYASFGIMTRPGPREIDRWLSRQPNTGAVIQVPLGFGGAPAYYASLAQKPDNLGFATFAPPVYRDGCGPNPSPEVCAPLFQFPERSLLRMLQRWQTGYIVVDEDKMTQAVSDWRALAAQEPLLSDVFHANGYRVYLLHR